MKKSVTLFLITVLFASVSNAKIRRVGFFGVPVANTDYISFTQAYNASANNDTILVFPNNEVDGTITKKLTIIGLGNWLSASTTPRGNANLQAFPGIATIGSISFSAGSDGSVIMGFYGGAIYVRDNNITIKRNRSVSIFCASTSPAGSINNMQILQNYQVSVASYYNNSSSSTNMNISNNLIYSLSFQMGNTYSGNISNNVWAYDNTQNTNDLNGGSSTMSNTSSINLGAGAWLLQNNILISYTNGVAANNYNYFSFSNGGNSVFNYNLAIQSSPNTTMNWGAGTGNVITNIANAANIFTAFPLIATTSADARYQLKAGSPALTIGAGGTAIGMFTGNYPYKLSTIPTIPTIYSLSSPQGNNPTGNTIQINLSTRGNN